jgi:hypothetical protein
MTYTKSASPCSDATATMTINVTNDFLSSGSSSNWSSTSAWGGGVVPLATGNVTISHDMTVDASTNTLGTVTVDASKTLTVGSGNTITAGGATDVNGTIAISGTYDANAAYDATSGTVTIASGGKLYLGSTITSFGTFSNVGTLYLDGVSAQAVPGSSSKAPRELCAFGGEYNVSGADKTHADASTDYQIKGDLTFSGATDVIIDNSAGATLTLYSGTTITDAQDDRHIIGPSGTDVSVRYSLSSSSASKELPIGPNGSLRSITIAPVDALGIPASTTTVYTAQYKVGTPGTVNWTDNLCGTPSSSTNVTTINNEYYYDVAVTTGTTTNADLTIGFIGLDNTPTAATRWLMHWDGSEWDEVAGSNSGNSGSVVTGTTTSFSPFTQGSSGSALPIDLLSFNGNCNGDYVDINFAVASQINNDYFTIYRSSNNRDWTIAGEISGAGNTSAQMNYSWKDYSSIKGTSYYQLSQTDFDGKSETFAPISVSCDRLDIEDYSAYPNPVKDELTIDMELDSYQGDNITLELVDINGRVAMQQKVTLERGFNSLNVEISDIPNGVYLLQFKGSKNHIKETRIIKQ